MVGGSFWRQAAHTWKRDWSALAHQWREVFAPGPVTGLFHYRFNSSAGQVRLHLRVHPDGMSELFIDALDIIHLTPSAGVITRMLLDGMTPQHIEKFLSRRHPEEIMLIRQDVQTLAQMIAQLKEPVTGCRVCAMQLPREEIFARRASAPFKVDLALSYRCNNHCAHCYNEPGRGASELDLKDWKRVIRRLSSIGIPHLVFTGGEPTLSPHLLPLLINAEKLGHITGLNTNGRRLSDMAFTRSLKRSGLDHVQITLASHQRDIHNATVGANAFDETVGGIQNALSAGLHTLTNTTLLSSNAEEALATLEFIKSLGVTTFAMNGMICSGGGRCNNETLNPVAIRPVLEAVRDRAQELGMRFLWYTPTRYCELSPLKLGLGAKACNAAEYSICIEPDGSVIPCQSFYEPAGNLLADDWDEIWNSPLFTRIRERRQYPAEASLPVRCHTCDDLKICGGGCMLEFMQPMISPVTPGD